MVLWTAPQPSDNSLFAAQAPAFGSGPGSRGMPVNGRNVIHGASAQGGDGLHNARRSLLPIATASQSYDDHADARQAIQNRQPAEPEVAREKHAPGHRCKPQHIIVLGAAPHFGLCEHVKVGRPQRTDDRPRTILIGIVTNRRARLIRRQ